MRIVTLDMRLLQEATRNKILDVPYFGNEKGENDRGFRSNKYNFENGIYTLDDLCYPSHFRDCILSMKLKQLSNLVAIYNQVSEMYWVITNRHTGREGWYTREEFEELVLKEIKPSEVPLT